MRWKIPNRILCLTLACSVLPIVSPLNPVRAAGEVVVVANPDLAEDVIARKDLQRIYLGKRTTWSDRTSIVPVMLKSGPLHEEFVEDLVGRSEHRFATYWRQMVFTGKGIPPKSFADEDEIISFVKATPGAVGYVSPSTDATGVKILTVD